MKLSAVAVAATVAGSAAAQTTAAPPVPDSSFYSVFKTGVPSSIIDLIITNPGSASTIISDGYTSGTSFWAGSFPSNVQSSLKDPNWRATNQVFNNPSLLTATTPITYPTTPFRSGSSTPARATGSGASTTRNATAVSASSRPASGSAAFTGGAPAATGAVGAGVALAAGIAGMLAL